MLDWKKHLIDNKWPDIKNDIEQKKIEWNELISIDYPIHILARHGKLNLIKIINPEILQNIISQPNLQGDTIAHIFLVYNNMSAFRWVISKNLDIIYILNNNNIISPIPIYLYIERSHLELNTCYITHTYIYI